MKINTKINKDLVLFAQDEVVGGYIYVDVHQDDYLIATLTYRNEGIISVEITNVSPRSLELITNLLIDNKDELIAWLEDKNEKIH